MKNSKLTPMMKQYYRLKSKYADSILLFRLGDFYEMFESDAREASEILHITLTKRNNVPMCGFPHHAAQSYISKLLRNGKKIAICEQQEDPKLAKGIVKREVVEVLSPGIIVDSTYLQDELNNSIGVFLFEYKKAYRGAVCAGMDVSTGEFFISSITDQDLTDGILNEIEENCIKEVLYPEEYEENDWFKDIIADIRKLHDGVVFRALDSIYFEPYRARENLLKHYSVVTLDVLELKGETEICAAGALLGYVKENLKKQLVHIGWIRRRDRSKSMLIDSATKLHLELVVNQTDGGKSNTLFDILDKTKTGMGERLLRKYINNPSTDISQINKRLEMVDLFYKNPGLLEKIEKYLSGILDIERILSKLSVNKANARDLLGLKESLKRFEQIRGILLEFAPFKIELDKIKGFGEIIATIENALVDEPPHTVREGGIIRDGVDDELDHLRNMGEEMHQWLVEYQGKLQNELGISSLKVKYNRIIGYYIEVTKPNLHLVPEWFIRKQTLVSSERFTTEELEQRQTLLLESHEKANEKEYEIFMDLCRKVLEDRDSIYMVAIFVATVDVAHSFAKVALENRYTRPELCEENIIEIKGGRHPVLEKIGVESFIANDLYLNDTDRRIMILTGPNMSGKSTFLRQSALIIIMAHMGSYVPAEYAKIGITDRIFSRIGMSDRLVKGQSTFLVEMIETSRILHYATPRSFVIMDEIGRGTSTYDGLSIAWSVIEYLLEDRFRGTKVLFATHYHEVTALGERYGIVNYNASVREWNNQIIFLRKIEPGRASRSYGIEVAKMAGLPYEIISRARYILHQLEKNYGDTMPLILGDDRKRGRRSIESSENEWPDNSEKEKAQLELFPSPFEILINELKNIDINIITPIQALNILEKLKKSLES